MTTNKTSLDLWVEESHRWLNYFAGKTSMRAPTRLMHQQMKESLSREDYSAVWRFVDRLKDLTEKIQSDRSGETLEKPEVRVECAVVAYRMGYLQESVKLFKSAIEMYKGKDGGHYEAVAKWMLGCVQWQIPSQADDAIVSWENSIEIFESFRSLSSTQASRANWYATQVALMQEALQSALDPTGTLRSPSPSPSSSSSSMPSAAPGSSPSGGGARTPNVDFLNFLPISEEIPAGGFGSTGNDPNPIGYVEIQQFIIEGCPYSITNLRSGGRIINFLPGESYGVIRVKGDSMNRAGIDDGDYVLLKIQGDADNTDTVAARINGIDTEATLKRFLRRPGKKILQFRSRNPAYQVDGGKDKEYEFTDGDRNLEIVGIALAVFKPIA